MQEEMTKVILKQKAIDDLNSIWTYTFYKWSEEQANKYYETIEFDCQQIGKNPEFGKSYQEISKSLLGFKSGKHIIFYQSISENNMFP
jgi:toxin ParE1/3/4